jgi:hypothetical protein
MEVGLLKSVELVADEDIELVVRPIVLSIVLLDVEIELEAIVVDELIEEGEIVAVVKLLADVVKFIGVVIVVLELEETVVMELEVNFKLVISEVSLLLIDMVGFTAEVELLRDELLVDVITTVPEVLMGVEFTTELVGVVEKLFVSELLNVEIGLLETRVDVVVVELIVVELGNEVD